MIYISFKKILEQFFALYEKSSTDKIRKIKSMLQQYQNLAANSIVRAKSQKNYKTFPLAFQQYLETMYKSPEHDKIVAVNVILAVIRAGCCEIDKAAPHCVNHNKQQVDAIKEKLGPPSTQQGIAPKWRNLGEYKVDVKDFIFEESIIHQVYQQPEKLSDILTGQIIQETAKPKPFMKAKEQNEQ